MPAEKEPVETFQLIGVQLAGAKKLGLFFPLLRLKHKYETCHEWQVRALKYCGFIFERGDSDSTCWPKAALAAGNDGNAFRSTSVSQ